jgi:D-alanine-D-alanine ligase-like ATP-grasp enzyme
LNHLKTRTDYGPHLGSLTMNLYKDANSEEYSLLNELTARGITLKSAVMQVAARKRALGVRRIDQASILVDAKIPFLEMNGPSSSVVSRHFLDRKDLSRDILKSTGLPVVQSQLFASTQIQAATDFAIKLGFPVVIKPRSFSRGIGVTTHIHSVGRLKEAWNELQNTAKKMRFGKTIPFLVEKHFEGTDARFFVVGGKIVSITFKDPPNVVGNGQSSIAELIRVKNQQRKQNIYLKNYLIPSKSEDLDTLQSQSLGLDYIPVDGEKIRLKRESYLNGGGDSVNATVHHSYIDVVRVISSAFHFSPYFGIDIMANDFSAKPSRGNFIVSELEFSPAPLAHFPVSGAPRDMAGSILDYYILKYHAPETLTG